MAPGVPQSELGRRPGAGLAPSRVSLARQCRGRSCSCLCAGRSGRLEVPACQVRPLLGGRSTVGHRALDAVIGVRIPASQPDFARASRELRLGRLRRPRRKRAAPHAKAVSPKRRQSQRQLRRRREGGPQPHRHFCDLLPPTDRRIRNPESATCDFSRRFANRDPGIVPAQAVAHGLEEVRLYPAQRRGSRSSLRRPHERRRTTIAMA
jgi:hypothetical protein